MANTATEAFGADAKPTRLASIRRTLATGMRPVVRAVGPVVGVVTTTGWLAIVASTVLLVVGLSWSWSEVLAVAFAATAAVVVAIVTVLGRTSFRVEVTLSPTRVVVGERAIGRVEITNVGSRRTSATRLELPVGDGLAVFAIPGLAPEAATDELFAVPTHRRAVIDAGPAVTVRGDQLGLFRRTVSWTEPIELFVHPVTTRLQPSAAGLVRDLEGQTTQKITNSDMAFHALREYVVGDDVRHVHWRSSARTGQLMVRQFEETRRSHLTILHTSDERYFASVEEFELAVSVTASVATQVIREATAIDVVTEGRRLRTHTGGALLDDTCRIDVIRGATTSPRDFARDATAMLPAPSVAVIVAGSRMTAADFRAIEKFFPSETRVIALRIAEGENPKVQIAGGLQIFTVGALRDLPRVLTRAS
ncbi:DUF58 domain-containing protein [Labedella phragmitis]|uniref:DUF58 domain-containing protein n=1 Tax=Labedella phragmitis TaxID=2498849 RepID=A0A444PRX3_9MICO|nr:DUF58 domain-containing protein [Labedella phragmitis]RWZ50021.1 DUF58 domain-containing protein [Labedella phragmitis]